MPAADPVPVTLAVAPGLEPGTPRLLWISGQADLGPLVSSACALVGLSPVAIEEPEEALARFPELLPELVLVDCAPDLAAAMSLCSRFQGRRGTDFRPVVAVLPAGAGESAFAAAASRFDDVIARPLERGAVVARLTLLRRHAEARRHLRLMAEAMAATPVPVGVVDAREPSLPLAICNPAFEALTGHRAIEPGALHRLEGGADQGGGRLVEAVRSCARWNARRQISVALRRPEGEPFGAELELSPVRDAAGDVTHVVVSQTPLALFEAPATRRAEAAAPGPEADRRRFTLALLERLHVGIVTTDSQARVSFVNRMAIETLGLDPVSCLGRELPELFAGEPLLSGALRSVADGGEQRIELTYARPDGRALELDMTVLRSAEHAPPEMAFVGLFRDLGAPRQVDLELRRVERLAALGNALAGFAREVRAPLWGLQALSEALHAELPPDDDRQEYLIRALTLVERIESFLRAALQFCEPGPPKRARRPPDAILEAALATLLARWGRSGSAPATHVAGPLPDVDVDEAQLAEALLALVENALEAAGDAVRVELAVRPETGPDGEASVCFEVQDGGPGIPEDQVGRVFEPFYTTKPRGTGLGLAIARALVRENGGRLSVESIPGRGATFRIHLPALPAPAA
jgi:signal transduction histidine kinase